MHESPRFSVVLPTFNRAHLLPATLASCLDQTWRDFELIVVDDGSTDATLEVLDAVVDPRLRVVSQANAGPASARNRGVALARGEYVAFLDSDDRWALDYLETIASALRAGTDHEATAGSDHSTEIDGVDEANEANGAATVLYGRLIVDRGVGRYWIKPERAIAPHEDIFDYLYVHGGFIQTSTLVVPRPFSRRVQWNERLTFGDNDQYVIDCWRAGARFRMLPEARVRYADAIRGDALSQLPIVDGRSARYRNFFAWMADQRADMSDAARRGFDARFLSVSLARESPARSLGLVFAAWRHRVIGSGGAARQLIQNFAPRSYRRLTDWYVGRRGIVLDESRLP